MINAGIAGLGRWGRNLVNAASGSERLRFVHGVVRNPDRVRDFAAQRGLALSNDFAGLLAAPDIQAVVLATPNSLHAAQIVAAADAGKAVFCEKPLALTRADAERAVAACRRAGVVLGVGQDKRFWPSMRELARIVASGELGELMHVEGHFSNENAARGLHHGWRAVPGEAPGGSITATGIHVLDAFVNMLGPVRRVHAQHVVRRPPPESLDTLSILLEFAHGASGVLCGVRATPLYWRVHVFGTRGSAEALGETELVLRRSGAPQERIAFSPVDALRSELEAFADALEGRIAYPVTTAQMIDVIAALEAIVGSIESRSPAPVR